MPSSHRFPVPHDFTRIIFRFFNPFRDFHQIEFFNWENQKTYSVQMFRSFVLLFILTSSAKLTWWYIQFWCLTISSAYVIFRFLKPFEGFHEVAQFHNWSLDLSIKARRLNIFCSEDSSSSTSLQLLQGFGLHGFGYLQCV